MSLYAVSEIRSHPLVERFLRQDINYAAYALADLEAPYSAHARWVGASRTGAIEALALVYDGIEPPALFLMGPLAAVSALLLHGVGPDAVTLLAPVECRDLLTDFYQIEHLADMDRMRVDPNDFQPYALPVALPLQPLNPTHAQEMLSLILQAARHDARDLRDIAFQPEMVETGTYFGIFHTNALIAMAGTHVEAPTASIAAVGNVVVHPARRGHGLGRAVSAAVTRSLLDASFEHIVLNVRRDNPAAVQTYRKLGYRKVSAFVEAIGHRL
jgi:GNAT superfamily N-acetyltransferase